MPTALPPVVVWFRNDLRVTDHEALTHAAASGRPVVPVWIDSGEDGAWAPGAATRWWLHHALQALAQDLADLGLRLVLRRGDERAVLGALARETGTTLVVCNERWEPAARARDEVIGRELAAQGIRVQTFPGALLWPPDTVLNRQGGPYKVFTPYWKRVLGEPAPPRPRAAPENALAPASWPASSQLSELALLPRPDWAQGLRDAWRPGSAGARKNLRRFLDRAVAAYASERDRPDRVGTSRLSPHLHTGEISARTVWHALEGVAGGNEVRRQLVWREFAHHLLHHFPETPDHPLDARFARFPWAGDAPALATWQRGRTGYPLVDAGMRELWATGWMHNRVRMSAASFLIKHLLIPWQEGAAWFWDTLVDADLANNTMGWQWVAGCGADAAPFFRVFNPVLQGRRFDPDGSYVRRWVPELTAVPDRWLHAPWEAPPLVLAAAKVRLGVDYPHPVVDHRQARARALAAWEQLRHG